jgi:small subunit ribosomal protein S19
MSRSNWKPTLIDTNLINSKQKIKKIYSRNLKITKDYLDLTVQVYNGTRFFETVVTKNMIGQKFGEFSPSRIKPTHKVKKKNK